jgi:hypothetical protein
MSNLTCKCEIWILIPVRIIQEEFEAPFTKSTLPCVYLVGPHGPLMTKDGVIHYDILLNLSVTVEVKDLTKLHIIYQMQHNRFGERSMNPVVEI